MPTIQKFEDIQSWQKGRELCGLIYDVSREGAFGKDYGLRDQIRRAGVSVISNIAGGYESQNNRAFVRYLYIARASAAEVRSQTYVALDQSYVTQEQFDMIQDLCTDIARLLTRFIAYLEVHADSRPPLPTKN